MLRLGEHLNSSVMFSELSLLIRSTVVYIFSVLLGNGTSFISS